MKKEEEAHTTVNEAAAIAQNKVEAEDTTTLERSSHLRKDCAILLATAC